MGPWGSGRFPQTEFKGPVRPFDLRSFSVTPEIPPTVSPGLVDQPELKNVVSKGKVPALAGGHDGDGEDITR
jgi:hypothetical protein